MIGETSHPERLGTYRLEKLLGRGGMGEVFLAWDERLERHVAIKRILGDVPADARARARFRREARAVARLSHPAIVQVFELLETEDGDCLVMEYVEGCGLVERIAANDLDLHCVLRLATEIADGLAEAHGKGLVHRDLKPENIRITPRGQAKILDFGLARLLFAEGRDRDTLAVTTEPGTLLGTVHAMSPEQASGRSVDHRSDLFALGSLLYEMLTGRAPFRGENVLDTLRRVTSEEPAPLAEQRLDLPAELVALVTDLMAKSSAARPQNARLVSETLVRIRARVGASAGVSVGEAVGSERASPEPAVSGSAASPGGLVPTEQTPRAAPTGGDVAELPTGEWPAPASEGDASKTAVRTLLVSHVIGLQALLTTLGDERAASVFARHDRTLRDLVSHHDGLEIEKADGFLLLFARPLAAVAFALAYQQRLATLSSELGVTLGAGIGIHLGEVQLRRNAADDVSRGARPLEVAGLTRSRVTSLGRLARARQILVSHAAFEIARHAVRDHERLDGPLRWLAHGAYLVEGFDEPLAIHEVGFENFAPLTAPADSRHARRVVSPSEELMLGWRPAPGQAVPQRAGWVLEARLGAGGFGEVWRAAHASGDCRVFKFCFEASRLRALKREVTLFRLMREALGHRDDIARVLDWQFDTAPFFLEVEHTDGGDLSAWAARQGGLGHVPMPIRLELVAQVADALAAAHSVGVLHKDVKPENILVTHDPAGQPRIRLADFGVGALLDPERLVSDSEPAPSFTETGSPESGFTETGLTETLAPQDEPAGSRRYLAPELLEGKRSTVQADLYSLGVVLYQMAVADFSRALADGWQRDVSDPLLVEDIALLVDGAPARRPDGARAVADRLRGFEHRRSVRAGAERADRRRHQLRRASWALLALLFVVSLLLLQAQAARRQAQRLQARAENARGQAESLIGFMLGDLQDKLKAIGRLDALESAGEKALAYFEALDEDEVGPQTLIRQADALHQMGDVRMAQGADSAALDLFARALRASKRLVERKPGDPDALFRLATSHFWLGNAQTRQGKNARALPSMEAYLKLCQQLHRDEPENPTWWLEVSYGHDAVGDMLLYLENAALALEHYRKALVLGQDLVAVDAERAGWRSRLGTAELKLARVSYEQGLLEDARSYVTRTIETFERSAIDERSGSLRRLALAHEWATRIQLDLGMPTEALAHSHRAVEIFRRLRALDPSHREWSELLAAAHGRQGHILALSGMPAEALDQLRTAIDLADEPETTVARTYLATAHAFMAHLALRTDRPTEALKQAERAITLLAPLASQSGSSLTTQQAFAFAQLMAGRSLARRGRRRAAMAAYQQVEEMLEPRRTSRHPRTLFYLAQAYRHLGRDDEARTLIYTLLGMSFRHPELDPCCGALVARRASTKRSIET